MVTKEELVARAKELPKISRDQAVAYLIFTILVGSGAFQVGATLEDEGLAYKRCGEAWTPVDAEAQIYECAERGLIRWCDHLSSTGMTCYDPALVITEVQIEEVPEVKDRPCSEYAFKAVCYLD